MIHLQAHPYGGIPPKSLVDFMDNSLVCIQKWSTTPQMARKNKKMLMKHQNMGYGISYFRKIQRLAKSFGVDPSSGPLLSQTIQHRNVSFNPFYHWIGVKDVLQGNNAYLMREKNTVLFAAYISVPNQENYGISLEF